MEAAGQMKRLLDKYQGLVSNPQVNLVIFPALIGLLPMPGGAVFSAPMVKELGADSKLSQPQLSFINYWFRHIWEHWWPLYPGILLVTIMTDINLLTIIAIMCPFTVIAVFLGYLILRNSAQTRKFNNNDRRSSVWPFLKELVPILIVIIPGLGMGIILSVLFPTFSVSKEAGLILALCMAIVWVWFENGTPKDQILQMLGTPRMLKMIYMIAAILIFKGILTDSNAAVSAGQEMVELHVPLIAIAITLPFIVGLSGGIVIAFVGSTFPILLPLINSFGHAEVLPAYVMLVLSCGFAGVMLSPLHLCFQLSNEFFETTMGAVYRYLWLPCLLLIGVSVLYFLFLSWIMLYI
jgi:integral membrane protein (TIGR00529 family)